MEADEKRERCLKRRRAQALRRHLRRPELRLFYGARTRAKRKGLPITITTEDISIPKVCPVLGLPLSSNVKRGSRDTSPTIDRRVPELGYVPGNIRVISHLANRIKSNATVDQIEAVARWLRKETHAA